MDLNKQIGRNYEITLSSVRVKWQWWLASKWYRKWITKDDRGSERGSGLPQTDCLHSRFRGGKLNCRALGLGAVLVSPQSSIIQLSTSLETLNLNPCSSRDYPPHLLLYPFPPLHLPHVAFFFFFFILFCFLEQIKKRGEDDGEF